jgi:hypothetical protein
MSPPTKRFENKSSKRRGRMIKNHANIGKKVMFTAQWIILPIPTLKLDSLRLNILLMKVTFT